MPHKFPGKLIVFEGCEGAGKSILIGAIAVFLRKIGYEVVETKEPGHATEIGRKVRKTLLDPAFDLTVEEELRLFIDVGRTDHFGVIVIPALREGKIVLCDRSSDSTTAYQYYGRKLYLNDSERKILTDILIRDAKARQNIGFDRKILLDINPEIGLKRKNPETRFEFEKIDFHHRVRRGYLEQVKNDSDKIWRIVDASKSEEDVFNEVREIILEFLYKRSRGGR